MKPRRTPKQKEMMGHILRKANEGEFMTLPELYDMMSYKDTCTLGAIRVSVRFLADDEMVVREKQSGRSVIIPTERGYDWFRPGRL